MPHKKAKRSVREQQRNERGLDLPPMHKGNSKAALESEAIPKSMARVLNATQIRSEWRDKKAKRELEDRDDGGKQASKKRRKGGLDGNKTKLSIQPGESLLHFNRRVEKDMAPLVRTALTSSSTQTRRVRKEELEHKERDEEKMKGKNKKSPADQSLSPSPERMAAKATESRDFSKAAPRKLNDVAQAPPELPTLRLATKKRKDHDGGTSKDSVLSLAQKVMMEQERENAIRRYREMKERKRAIEVP